MSANVRAATRLSARLGRNVDGYIRFRHLFHLRQLTVLVMFHQNSESHDAHAIARRELLLSSLCLTTLVTSCTRAVCDRNIAKAVARKELRISLRVVELVAR